MSELFDETFHHAAANLDEAQQLLDGAEVEDPRPRARALGLALKQPPDDGQRAILGHLIPWFVARYPNDFICLMPPFGDLVVDTGWEHEVTVLWLDHESTRRLDGQGFLNAGVFFGQRDWRRAERFMLRATEFPEHSENALVSAGKFRALLAREENDRQAASEHRHAALGHLRQLAGTAASEWSDYATQMCADLCCEEGHCEEAEAHARRALTLPSHGSPLHHAAETVIGRLALVRGDMDAALAALERAGVTAPDFVSSSYGPRLALAKALLAAGERGAVANYLRARAATWKCGEGRAERWIAAIEAGGQPDWGDYSDHI